jgi:hypothetical protein
MFATDTMSDNKTTNTKERKKKKKPGVAVFSNNRITQLLHRIMPVPLQVPQPKSLSDHFVHRHGILLDLSQVAKRNPPAIGF